jgi:septum site-determining protein MinC
MTSATDKTNRRRRATGSEAFVIKSASIEGLALVLKTSDLAILRSELHQRFGDTPLSATPLLFDVSNVDAAEQDLRLAELVDLARQYQLQPVAIVGAHGALLDDALRLGLGDLTDVGYGVKRPTPEKRRDAGSTPPPQPATPEQLAQLEATQRQAIADAVNEALSTRTAPTLVVTKPMRSGQRIYAQGGDLIVCGMVSHGAEVLADGHVHVYGPLRGRAIAGARGNTSARIFTSCMEPDLYAIAGIYNTTDIPLAKEIQGKPAQVRLDGERLIVEPLKG